MATTFGDEYLTIQQASAVFGVRASEIRRLLREYGLGELVRTSMRKDVLIRRGDLDKILPSSARSRRGGAA